MKKCVVLCLAAFASANIIFKTANLRCDVDSDRINYGCMPGTQCNEDHICTFSSLHHPLPPRSDVKSRRKRDDLIYSIDGKCGVKYGDTICDPNLSFYDGSCCSEEGYCGNSDLHCGIGCQSGCDNENGTSTSNTSISTTTLLSATTAATELKVVLELRQEKVTTDGTCGAKNGGTICGDWLQGNCCSLYGFCGKSEAYCGAGCQSGNCTATSDPLTTDGSCGAQNGRTICGNWPQGNCCSQNGFCGKSEGHCGEGCQSGDCLKKTTIAPTSTAEPVLKAATSTMPPADQATAPVTTDGSCGAGYGYTVCGDWAAGSCCSPYGFCGKTASHCGVGCQSGNCLTKSTPGPGPKPAPSHPSPGAFKVVGEAGVPAMHAALMPNGRVVFLDKVEDYTQVKLPNGRFAFSSEYDPVTNTYVPLSYSTNAFCSGGAFLPDGRVVSLGGNGPLLDIDPTVTGGLDAIRYLGRATDGSQNGQNWEEPGNKLASARWYASVQTMPDGTLFCASGSLNGLEPNNPVNNNPTYEILNAQGISAGANIPMEILEKNQPYYMYPFIHLLADGTLFVFTSKSSQQFDVSNNAIVRAYPDLAGEFRTYPNTGGSVLLALSSANNWEADVVICGGGVWQTATSATDASCGRISPLAADPQWEMDAMPEGRGMVEGTLLPDGTVVWLNGGSIGAQGFEMAGQPALTALLYSPDKPLGQRWNALASSAIPRLYHSVALLLLDGTMMVAGSNPVEMPKLVPDAKTPFVTEFRVENYVPPYLQGGNAERRPTNVVLSSMSLKPGDTFTVDFEVKGAAEKVSVVLYHGGFVTHSLHMGHRMAVCDTTGFVAGEGKKTVVVSMPPSNNVVPPGPYVVYVLVDGVPGMGQFVSVA